MKRAPPSNSKLNVEVCVLFTSVWREYVLFVSACQTDSVTSGHILSRGLQQMDVDKNPQKHTWKPSPPLPPSPPKKEEVVNPPPHTSGNTVLAFHQARSASPVAFSTATMPPATCRRCRRIISAALPLPWSSWAPWTSSRSCFFFKSHRKATG